MHTYDHEHSRTFHSPKCMKMLCRNIYAEFNMNLQQTTAMYVYTHINYTERHATLVDTTMHTARHLYNNTKPHKHTWKDRHIYTCQHTNLLSYKWLHIYIHTQTKTHIDARHHTNIVMRWRVRCSNKMAPIYRSANHIRSEAKVEVKYWQRILLDLHSTPFRSLGTEMCDKTNSGNKLELMVNTLN